MNSAPFLYLAPLRGITDALFRNVFTRHFGGFDMAVAPFLPPQRNPSNKKKLLAELFPEVNRQLPVIPQLLNNNGDEFLDLALRLEDLGYTSLNWNLGCPAPMVANKGRGSGLLPYPDDIINLLDQVVPKLSATLSIKMRLGFREKRESIHLLPRLNAYPLDEIIIHPRLGKQLYKGRTDPDGFADCLALTRHRLVYNGDITSADVYSGLAERFPEISRWMIGRGVLANPFLAEELKGTAEDSPARKTERLRAFHDDLCEAYRQQLSGPGHLLGKMKQLWLYLVFSFPGKDKIFKKLKKAHTEQQFQEAAEAMFADRPLLN
jgi:tRNA-dihydrouridine synthase